MFNKTTQYYKCKERNWNKVRIHGFQIEEIQILIWNASEKVDIYAKRNICGMYVFQILIVKSETFIFQT